MFLRESRAIETVKRRGHRVATPWFNMLIERQTERESRVAIVIGKRFGIAVRRNRAKRVFRELVRATYGEFQPGHNLVIFPKREVLDASFEELRSAWRNVLRKQRVLTTSV